MRSIYTNQNVISQVKKLRTKLWLSLIPLCPVFIMVFLDQDPERFYAYTGLTFWPAFAICMVFTLAGVWYARKIWRCPVCNAYLGNDIFTKFCPHCATYVAIPRSVTPVYTDDENLYRGGALLPSEEYAALVADDNQKILVKRYRRQIIFSIAFTVLVGGLAIVSDIQSDRVNGNFQFGFDTIRLIVLSFGGVFSFCWCAIFFFYFDDWLLSRYNNRVTRALMGLYNADIIKMTFTFLVALLVMAVTVGIFGFWFFFRTRSALKLLTSSKTGALAQV